MSRFYVPEGSVIGNSITVSGREAHHILNVMRLKKSDKVVAFDGTGREYIGIIKTGSPKSLVIEITETRTPPKEVGPEITLIQAVPKKEKMDYIVEKAVELGVDKIIPVMTERTIVKWNDDKRRSCAQRWRRIAVEASKQCGRSDIPEIVDLTDCRAAFKKTAEDDIKLIAALSDEAIPLKEALGGLKGRRVSAAIGPEGDFTADEVKAAKALDFKLVNLGPRVLKSDTAGLFILSTLDYELTG